MNVFIAAARNVACLALLAFTLASSAWCQEVTMGNGDENSIVVDGMTRDARVFLFQEVTLAEPGWLVLHPFEDGKRP